MLNSLRCRKRDELDQRAETIHEHDAFRLATGSRAEEAGGLATPGIWISAWRTTPPATCTASGWTLLGEYPSLKTVSRIAKGIDEHGLAFAAWAAYVGPERDEQLDRFEDHYLSEHESMEAHANGLLIESEAERIIQEAPEWLRPHIVVDTKAYARDLGSELHVEETPGGGVWVFDTCS